MWFLPTGNDVAGSTLLLIRVTLLCSVEEEEVGSRPQSVGMANFPPCETLAVL